MHLHASYFLSKFCIPLDYNEQIDNNNSKEEIEDKDMYYVPGVIVHVVSNTALFICIDTSQNQFGYKFNMANFLENEKIFFIKDTI